MDYISINTPILVSNSYVTKNFVIKHEIGLVADSGNIDDYYQKAKRMLENKELYKELLANVYKLQKNPKITWEYKCTQILNDLN